VNCGRNRPRPLSHPRRLIPTRNALWKSPLHFPSLLRAPTSAPMRRNREKPKRHHSSGILASQITTSTISARWSTLKVASLSMKTVETVEKLMRRPVDWRSFREKERIEKNAEPREPTRFRSFIFRYSTLLQCDPLTPHSTPNVANVTRWTWTTSSEPHSGALCAIAARTRIQKSIVFSLRQSAKRCAGLSSGDIRKTADIGYTMAGLFIDRSYVDIYRS
jgi:hypothetical protein